jgi:4-hydroxybenzoate polyprenyltransferase
MITATDQIVPDSEHRGLVARLPQPWRDYALLARLDRPIGWWLLFWPCAWGVFLAGGARQWHLVAWMLLGSIAMRGAGCVYNDIVDADLDARVARTAQRPVASGRVRKKAAWAWLLLLAAVGLVVLLQLRWQAQLVALGSLALVAAYPFMKRITWWPQAWLGLVFTWGAPPAGSRCTMAILARWPRSMPGRCAGASAMTRSMPCKTARTTRSSASAPARGRWAAR